MGKSVDAVFRIEGFWLRRPFEASYELTCQLSVDSLQSSWQDTVLLWMACFSQKPRNRTGRPFPLQAKRKAGKERMLPRERCMFPCGEQGRVDLHTAGLNQPVLSPLSLQVSPLQARGAAQTLSLFPLSVLPPLSLLRRAGHRIHSHSSLFLRAVLLLLFSCAFP